VRLAGFLAVLLALPALGQPSASYGTRIGQVQTAYFEDLPVGMVNALDISDRFREIVDAARSSGAIVGPDGRAFAPAPVTKGPRAEFETWAVHRSKEFAESVVTGNTGIERAGGKATVHRFARDNFRNTNLTYTVAFEALPGTARFRVTFSDAAIPVPVPQILRDGEEIALTLAVDARTGRRLIEYIRVGSGVMSPRRDVTRDVYAEDAELAINQPRVRMNGVERTRVDQSAEPVTLSAPVVQVNIPGQGRYLLSFKPRAAEGFERVGEATQNSLAFSIDGNIFRVDCADRIATGSGTYNIYARKDPAANTKDDATVVTFAAQR
jgi:hypothetical protein